MILYFLTAILVFCADFFSKKIILNKLSNKNKIQVNKILEFKLVENEGIAFGIFYGRKKLVYFVSTIGILSIIMIFIFYIMQPEVKKLFLHGMAMITGGGIANLYDRYKFGYVNDFIKFSGTKLPVFNVADLLIFAGAILMVVFEV